MDLRLELGSRVDYLGDVRSLKFDTWDAYWMNKVTFGCSLMPSCNTYHLTWVSLILVMGYPFTLLLTLDEGYLLRAAPPDLERGVAPLGPPVPVQLLLLGRGVAPLGCAPDLRRGVAPLSCRP